MRHGKKFNHLGRQKGHREAMLSNMAASLIVHKRINTTIAKAKALRKYVEPIITRSKTDSTHSRRVAFSYLQSKDAIKELFSAVAAKVGERPGGYTRILRTGFRSGDSAEMCMIELVDFNDSMLDAGSTKKKSRRRTKKKVTSEAPAEAAIEDAEVVEVAEENPVAEVKAEEAPKAEKEEGKEDEAKKGDSDK
ncbi:MAG: large subunit ribosomal protein L17 [Glaciecola sp.]|jgi:large subunit ribosomal protein L17